MATIDFDRTLREIQHQKNRTECRVIEFGRWAYTPRRRFPDWAHDTYDAITNWIVVLGGAAALVAALVFVGIGFGQVVLWLGRVVR